MTQSINKQDILGVAIQRDAIGAMIRKRQEEPPCELPDKPSASAPTQPTSTSPSIAAPTPATANAPPAPAPTSGPPPPEPDPTDYMTEDPPLWIQQASLSELLLWRLGIPADRDRIEREHKQTEAALDLKPPLTTRKVADAIAQLSMQVIRGDLDAGTAKTSLYALQTLLTALRLQIIEAKKPKDTTKKKTRKPAPTSRRRKQIAKPKRRR